MRRWRLGRTGSWLMGSGLRSGRLGGASERPEMRHVVFGGVL